MDLQFAKILSRILHPLVSPKILSMHRNNISFTISIKSIYIKSYLFYLCPRFQTRKKSIKHTQIHAFETKISTYLTLSKHKALPLSRSYLFSSDRVSFLASSFASQVEYCALQQQIYTQSFSFLYFSSQQSQFQVPTMEPFVGIGVDPGFNTTRAHQENPNYWPFRQHL